MRLIDADELHKELEKKGRPIGYNEYKIFYDLIDDAPTIDQWHYPSKGEYPTEKDRQYFCKVKKCKKDWYEVVGWTGKYWILNDDEEVVAWQYFVPPKEEA